VRLGFVAWLRGLAASLDRETWHQRNPLYAHDVVIARVSSLSQAYASSNHRMSQPMSNYLFLQHVLDYSNYKTPSKPNP
jgi:hypothetical protein